MIGHQTPSLDTAPFYWTRQTRRNSSFSPLCPVCPMSPYGFAYVKRLGGSRSLSNHGQHVAVKLCSRMRKGTKPRGHMGLIGHAAENLGFWAVHHWTRHWAHVDTVSSGTVSLSSYTLVHRVARFSQRFARPFATRSAWGAETRRKVRVPSGGNGMRVTLSAACQPAQEIF